MKKVLPPLLLIAVLLLYACGGAENRADTSAIPGKKPAPVSSEPKNAEPASAGTDSNRFKNDPNDILSNIDNYLVTEAKYQAGNPSGISHCTVTVRNTLADIIVQKAIVEVRIFKETGEEYRSDYFIITNVEPGTAKTVKVPNAVQGSKVTTHIVKLKSDVLTNGETILVGSRYVPR